MLPKSHGKKNRQGFQPAMAVVEEESCLPPFTILGLVFLLLYGLLFMKLQVGLVTHKSRC